jgi:hypothetical protein
MQWTCISHEGVYNMKNLIAIKHTPTVYDGNLPYSLVILLSNESKAFYTQSYKTEAAAKGRITRFFGRLEDYERVSLEELRAEEQRRNAPIQEQEELQHEAQVVETVEEVQSIEALTESPETLLVKMNMAQYYMNQASDEDSYFGAKAERDGHRSRIEAQGYSVTMTVTGWMLVEPVIEQQEEEVAQAASTPKVIHYPQYFQGYKEGLPEGFIIERQGTTFICFYTTDDSDESMKRYTLRRFQTEDERGWRDVTFPSYEEAYRFMHGFLELLKWMGEVIPPPTKKEVIPMRRQKEEVTILGYEEDREGMFARVTSRSEPGKEHQVRVCCKWLYSFACDCRAGRSHADCTHRAAVDLAMLAYRPTLKEQMKEVRVKREVIDELLGRVMKAA